VAYNIAKQEAKKAVAKEKDTECERFADILNEKEGRKKVFKIVKQVTKQNSDVTESSCIKGTDGIVITDQNKARQTWKDILKSAERGTYGSRN